MEGFLNTGMKALCYGCEACVQICCKSAIIMKEDEEGFRYPQVDAARCVDCRMCNSVCPYENTPTLSKDEPYVFGGYHLDSEVRFESTSGGAFSAIVDTFCDENYAIFGAEAKGLDVFHSYVMDKAELAKYRKSKYSQSVIGHTYRQCRQFLKEGKKVLYSGTPCQIAGLRAFLGDVNQEKLLTVEVVCEGVPSPLYVRKYEQSLEQKYGSCIRSLDYRNTGKSCLNHGKWDFQVMKTELADGKKLILDRWFNPFWSVWLKHLMSRPSCYLCQFAQDRRGADITLGDLWGVHLYCPELYGKNGGASVIFANTEKGKMVLNAAQKMLYGHALQAVDAIRYQGPMRNHIAENPERECFMQDLCGKMSYQELNQKWAVKPTGKTLWQKYVWGNRQKVAAWKIKNILTKGRR